MDDLNKRFANIEADIEEIKRVEPEDVPLNNELKHNHSGGDSVKIKMQNLTGRVEKYAVISAATFKLGATAPTIAVEGTFSVLQFSNTRTESAYVNWHIPKDWKIGTDIKIAYYWAPTSTGAGGVAWEFDWEAVAANADEVLGAGSTHVDVHDVTEEVDNELLETGYGVIAGESITTDDTLGICILRDHDDGDDTYAAPAALVHIEIEYVSDKIGQKI